MALAPTAVSGRVIPGQTRAPCTSSLRADDGVVTDHAVGDHGVLPDPRAAAHDLRVMTDPSSTTAPSKSTPEAMRAPWAHRAARADHRRAAAAAPDGSDRGAGQHQVFSPVGPGSAAVGAIPLTRSAEPPTKSPGCRGRSQ